MTKVDKILQKEKEDALREKEKSMILQMVKLDKNKNQTVDEEKYLSMCEFLTLQDIRVIIASL